MSRLNRRDFLKAMGLTGTVSAASACNWDDNRYLTPVENVLPYVVKDEAVVPGTPTFFATTVTTGPDAYPVNARHREGRVVNVGANPASPWANAVPASALLSLQRHYSPDRRTGPVARVGGAFEAATWDELIPRITAAAVSAGAAGLGYVGPYRSGAIAALITDLTGGDAVFLDPIGYAIEADAAEALFGRRFLPAYDLTDAQYVLSFGADFLGAWRGGRHASEYASARHPGDGVIARYGFVGAHLDQTAANADDWISVAPGTEHLVALAVARKVADRAGTLAPLAQWLGDVNADALASQAGVPSGTLDQIAEHLTAGPSVAIPGGTAGASAAGRDLAIATYLINLASGAAGHLFGDGPTYGGEVHGLSDLDALLAKVEAGTIKVLLVDDVDPVGALPGGDAIGDRMAAADMTVSLSSFHDATAARADICAPTHDVFEDWGSEDVEAGLTLVRQPVTTPLHNTRGLGDLLLTLAQSMALSGGEEAWDAEWSAAAADVAARIAAGEDMTGAEPIPPRPQGYGAATFREHLRATLAISADDPTDAWWHDVLAQGFHGDGVTPITAPAVIAPASPIAMAPAPFSGSGNYTLHVYPHAFRRDGRYANEPWAQETPDPLTGQTWDTWVELHPETALALGVVDNDLVSLTTDAGTVSLGVEITPAVRKDVVAVALGQGHDAKGRYAAAYGENIAKLLAPTARTGGDYAWQNATVTVAATGQRAALTSVLGGDTQVGRGIAPVAPAAALAAVGDTEHEEPGVLTGIHEAPRDRRLEERGELDFYPVPDHPHYRWAMTIDTNACNGCGTCVIACYAENNLPVVGKEIVGMGREMNWLRVNRYWETNPDGTPDARFVPMMCQQCGHAPCESVCPVLATYHNLEGLNAMVYNRCVGTRYCANNCPYQTRRFNFHTYTWPEPFNLQLNPDITARVMGVMEKCTFCVQRIRETKSAYRDAGFTNLVPSADVEQLPACAEACPTSAITFGNRKEEAATVATSLKSARSYEVFAELRTFPGVNYLARASFHAAPPSHGGGHDEAADDHSSPAHGAAQHPAPAGEH